MACCEGVFCSDHFMNNISRNASGDLLMEPLNDANAIAEFKGIYHIMMQEGGYESSLLDFVDLVHSC